MAEMKTEIDLKPLGAQLGKNDPVPAAPPGAKPKIVSKRRRVKLAPPPKSMQVDVDVYGENNFFASFDRKVANGGLFVASLETLPQGHELELDIVLEGKHIKTRAKVDWVRVDNFSNNECTAGAGFKLLNLTPAQQSQVEAFFAKREPMFFHRA